jgi:hypothetical protein
MNTLSTLRKRKADDSPREGQKSKHSKQEHPKGIEVKDAPLPKHGKWLFIQASLFWQNEYGRNRQCQGKFLIDSGCTGTILNAEFVAAHKLP